MLESVKNKVLQLGSEGLSAAAVVGNKVAGGGELLGRGLHVVADNLDSISTGLPAQARQRLAQISAGTRYVGDAVTATFAVPLTSSMPSINFQAGLAAAADSAFLALGAGTALFPGVHWMGSGTAALYGLSRCVPGALAKLADREDALSRQSFDAGKLILTTAVSAALLPPVLAAGVYAGAMTVTARNTDTLLKA